MTEKQIKSTSKFLSLVLRHQPDLINITLTESGWVAVDRLLQHMGQHGKKLTIEQLAHVVETNDKQRFEFSDDRKEIRARQGHSVSVELGYKPTEPPNILYHGTPKDVVSKIQTSGLKKQKRHDVHLHQNTDTASEAGGRRGKPVLLMIQSKKMFDDGFEFFVTENKVWLTDNVPPEYINFPEN
ncbi:MAG: RNA 2'-phosphotransferase [Mariniblastus sp.]